MGFMLELTQYDPYKLANKSLVLTLDPPLAIHPTPPVAGAEHPYEWIARGTNSQYLLWGKYDIGMNSVTRKIDPFMALGNMKSGRNPLAYRWALGPKQLEFVELTDGDPRIVMAAQLDEALVDAASGIIAHLGTTDSVGEGRIFKGGQSVLFNIGKISWKCLSQIPHPKD